MAMRKKKINIDNATFMVKNWNNDSPNDVAIFNSNVTLADIVAWLQSNGFKSYSFDVEVVDLTDFTR